MHEVHLEKVREPLGCPRQKKQSERYSTPVLPQQLAKVYLANSTFSLLIHAMQFLTPETVCKLFHWNFLQYEVWLRGSEGGWTFFWKRSVLKLKKKKSKQTKTPPRSPTFWQRMCLKVFRNYPLRWTTLSNSLAFGRGTVLSALLQSVILLWVDPNVNSLSNHFKKVSWEFFGCVGFFWVCYVCFFSWACSQYADCIMQIFGKIFSNLRFLGLLILSVCMQLNTMGRWNSLLADFILLRGKSCCGGFFVLFWVFYLLYLDLNLVCGLAEAGSKPELA